MPPDGPSFGEDLMETLANRDLARVKLLAVLHFVLAGLFALFAFLPLIHLVTGLLVASGSGTGSEAARPDVGWTLVGVSLVMMAGALAYAGCLAWAGKSLWRRRRYWLCLVVDILSLPVLPLGTALGILGVVYLRRPGVRDVFRQAR